MFKKLCEKLFNRRINLTASLLVFVIMLATWTVYGADLKVYDEAMRARRDLVKQASDWIMYDEIAQNTDPIESGAETTEATEATEATDPADMFDEKAIAEQKNAIKLKIQTELGDSTDLGELLAANDQLGREGATTNCLIRWGIRVLYFCGWIYLALNVCRFGKSYLSNKN